MTVSDGAKPRVYTSAEAIEAVGINQNIFRWIVATEPSLRLETFGKRVRYDDEVIARIRAFIKRKDPGDRFIGRSGPRRKNGPNRRTRAAAGSSAN